MLSETTEQTAQTSPAIVGKPGASPSSSNWRQGFPSLSNKLRHSFKYLCAVRAHKAIGFGRLRPGRFCSCAPKSVENRRRVTVRAGIAFASPQPHPRFETKAFPKPQNFPLHLPRCLLGAPLFPGQFSVNLFVTASVPTSIETPGKKEYNGKWHMQVPVAQATPSLIYFPCPCQSLQY